MAKRYWLDVRDKPGLLRLAMSALAGRARMSFEGDLSHCKGLFGVPGATSEECGLLGRNTSHPRLEFVVVPLEANTVASIFKEIEPEGRIARDIVHIQIEEGGSLVLGAYDNFNADGCVVWEATSEAWLSELQAKGILRSYQARLNLTEALNGRGDR